MKQLFVLIMAITLLTTITEGVEKKMNTENEQTTLLKLDGAIAAVAAKEGLLEAFLPYTTPDSVLLPVFGHPAIGTEMCRQLLQNDATKGQLIHWQPLSASVSTAGDLGYTHGRFQLPGAAATDYNYYSTIWKKQSDGSWRLAVSQGLFQIKEPPCPPVTTAADFEKTDANTGAVAATEIAFSNYSIANGIAPAFLEFIDDAGRVISQQGPPRTKETYTKAVAAAKEKKDAAQNQYRLEWKPLFVRVSASGDLAYDYGSFIFTQSSADGRAQYEYGYFTTVWKKQADNTWKFVQDAGNSSPIIETSKFQ